MENKTQTKNTPPHFITKIPFSNKSKKLSKILNTSNFFKVYKKILSFCTNIFATSKANIKECPLELKH